MAVLVIKLNDKSALLKMVSNLVKLSLKSDVKLDS